MLENLTKKLDQIFKKVRGAGLLTPQVIEQTLKEVKMALLEADVHYKVVQSFIESVREKAVTVEVLEGLNPGQQVIKIVWETLSKLMGEKAAPIVLSAFPAIVMLVGLQGSGKTTTAGKLANWYKKEGKHVLLVAADLHRPAAVHQLKTLGEAMGVSVVSPDFKESPKENPPEHPIDVMQRAVRMARDQGFDLVIVDTAGRHQVNELLMEELVLAKTLLSPDEILFVADAMTGQVAAQVAQTFHQRIGMTGIILTKMEGDARGGTALSIRSISGAPIKFIGMGEKPDDLERFYPERMASRILGMGDVLSLIELAEKNSAPDGHFKVGGKQFTLDDFRIQLKQFKKIGHLEQLLDMIPGLKGAKVRPEQGEMEKEIRHIDAIISSMTLRERHDPDIINGSRKKRISTGSGVSVQEINRFLKQFHQARKIVKQLSGGRGLHRMLTSF